MCDTAVIGVGCCLLSVFVVRSAVSICLCCCYVLLCWLWWWLQDFELSPQTEKWCSEYEPDRGFVNRVFGAVPDSPVFGDDRQQKDEALIDCHCDVVCCLFGVVGVM